MVGSTRKQKLAFVLLAFWTLRFVLDRHHHFLSFVQGGKPGKQETALPGMRERETETVVFSIRSVCFACCCCCFAGGLREAVVIFCAWLQEMCWDLVKLWWKFSNVAMDHQSWSKKVCQEGLGLISGTAAWVKMMLSTKRWLWWGSSWPKTPERFFRHTIEVWVSEIFLKNTSSVLFLNHMIEN